MSPRTAFARQPSITQWSASLPATPSAAAKLYALAVRLAAENQELANRGLTPKDFWALETDISLTDHVPARVRKRTRSAGVPVGAATTGRLRDLVGRGLWVLALCPLASLMGLWSHMGVDANARSLTGITPQALVSTGLVAVSLWLVALGAAWGSTLLSPSLRHVLPTACLTLSALMLTGIFWTVGLSVTHFALQWPVIGAFGSLGGLLGLVLWLRALSLALRGFSSFR